MVGWSLNDLQNDVGEIGNGALEVLLPALAWRDWRKLRLNLNKYRRFWFLFPRRERDFSLLRGVQNGFWAHTASHTMGTEGSFPGENNQGVKMTIHLNLVLRSRMTKLYFHSQIYLHGIVLDSSSTGTDVLLLLLQFLVSDLVRDMSWSWGIILLRIWSLLGTGAANIPTNCWERCFICGPRRDCLLGNFVVTCLCNSGGSGVFSVAWSEPRRFEGRSRTKRMGKQRRTTGSMRLRTESLVVTRLPLEVSLWRLSVWSEYLLTVRLF
jgi:hypothetical protein